MCIDPCSPFPSFMSVHPYTPGLPQFLVAVLTSQTFFLGMHNIYLNDQLLAQWWGNLYYRLWAEIAFIDLTSAIATPGQTITSHCNSGFVLFVIVRSSVQYVFMFSYMYRSWRSFVMRVASTNSNAVGGSMLFICCFIVSEEYNTSVICNSCSSRVQRGGKKKWTQQMLLELWNVKSSVHYISASLTLRLWT